MRTSLNQSKKFPGQILVITLLALVIISIIIVGLFNLTTRDVQQTVANREYERLYNAAESKIFELVDEFGSYTDVDLPSLIEPSSPSELRNIGTDCVTIDPSQINCDFTEGTTLVSMEVDDTDEIIDFELGKDDSLTLNLSGYRGDIEFNVSSGSALEFSLVYTLSGEPYVINDYFDLDGVFDSNGGDPLSDPNGTHAFSFLPVAGTSNYRFTIGNIAGLPLSARPEFITLTGRRDSEGIALLDVSGNAGFPNQIRRLTTISYDQATQTNVVARVVTQIPLAPQQLSLFNYVLLTPDTVTKTL